MRRYLLLTLSFLLFVVHTYAQMTEATGKSNIDSLTLLNLIKKLCVKNEDANPVGSIISFKDKAITPLTNFLDTCKNKEGKYLAIYTLYLIGINSNVPYSGGFYEKFVNKNARTAMLRFIDDKVLTGPIVEQLLQDPWITDIPNFMNYLSKPGSDYITILKALKNYSFKGSPLVQKAPKDLQEKKIEVKTTNPDSTLAMSDQIAIKSANNRDRATFDLIAIKNLNDPNFVVDEEILKSPHWTESVRNLNLKKTFTREKTLRSISSYYYFFPSENIYNEYFYNFNENKLHVYGPIKAREIWLNWWEHLTKEERAAFYESNSPSLFKGQR